MVLHVQSKCYMKIKTVKSTNVSYLYFLIERFKGSVFFAKIMKSLSFQNKANIF